jgi:hypothetical protein
VRSEAFADAGLTVRFIAAVRRHPGVSVPVAAAALAAGVGFSVSTYVYAAALAQSEDLHVPGRQPVTTSGCATSRIWGSWQARKAAERRTVQSTRRPDKEVRKSDVDVETPTPSGRPMARSG